MTHSSQNLIRRQDAGTNSGNNNETATTNNNTAPTATIPCQRTEVPSGVTGQVNVDNTNPSATPPTQASNENSDAANGLAAAAAQGAGSYNACFVYFWIIFHASFSKSTTSCSSTYSGGSKFSSNVCRCACRNQSTQRIRTVKPTTNE